MKICKKHQTKTVFFLKNGFFSTLGLWVWSVTLSD